MVQKKLLYGGLIFSLALLSPGFALADLSHLEDDRKVLDVSAGYRWVSTDDNPNRAAEYSFLDDSPTFNLVYKQDSGNRGFSLAADFLNENDYSVEGSFDYKALIRLNARSERMYHNLEGAVEAYMKRMGQGASTG